MDKRKVSEGEENVPGEKPDSCARAQALHIVNGVLFLSALAMGSVGVWFVVSSGYAAPPIPLGHLVGNFFALLGASMCLSSTVSMLVVLPSNCTRKTGAFAARATFALVWGLGLVAFGVFRFWLDHPWTYTACPCPEFHAKLVVEGVETCVPCPGFSNNCTTADCLCGDRGTCDESTATCVCDSPNWQVSASTGMCDECSDRAMDGEVEGQCGRCTARWKPSDPSSNECDVCRNGYVDEGNGCKKCADNFAPRRNASGIMYTDDGAEICTPVRGCKDDVQPDGGGRWGPNCEAVAPDRLCRQHGDPKAELAAENNKMILSRTFTSTGESCSYHSDCPNSYSCLGYCAFREGSVRAGQLCEEDSDCLGGNGACVARTCGAEPRIAVNDYCRCTAQPWQGPRCEQCPGYSSESGWTSSICGGRGTCAPVYLDSGKGYLDVYSHLTCMCGKPTSTIGAEFPKWTGSKCQRAVNEDFTTAFCAPGFFGPECDVTCPSDANADDDSDTWGGARACSARGSCVYDAEENRAECVCDMDDRVGGDGWFTGGTCQHCAPHFWGVNCNTCPKLVEMGEGACDDATYLIPPDEKTCHASCGVKTCDDGKTGTGRCS